MRTEELNATKTQETRPALCWRSGAFPIDILVEHLERFVQLEDPFRSQDNVLYNWHRSASSIAEPRRVAPASVPRTGGP